MAKFEEIIKIESERSELGAWRFIYLHKEGPFCHAYEQSAWLYTRFAAVALNPTRHKSKKFPDGSYVMVGHPPTSIEKFQPKDSEQKQEENLITITLPENCFPPELTVEVLQGDYVKWKQELPMVETKVDTEKEEKTSTQKNLSKAEKHQPKDMLDLIRQIVAYPIDNRTPLETMQFVSDLKRQISTLITETK